MYILHYSKTKSEEKLKQHPLIKPHQDITDRSPPPQIHLKHIASILILLSVMFNKELSNTVCNVEDSIWCFKYGCSPIK